MNIKHLVLSIFVNLGVTSCDLGNFESVLITPHYSIFYSENFAMRFSLPVAKAVNLNNAHLKAIAIGVQKIDKQYQCTVNLYYDDVIKLYLPNGQNTFFRTNDSEGFFVKKYNEIDFQSNYKIVSKNISPALYRSKSVATTKKGVVSTIGYTSYKKHILPDLNIASLEVGCAFLDSRDGDAEVWIKKEGIENYDFANEDSINLKHPENNYRFDVPLALLQSVKPMIDRIIALPVDPTASNVSVQYGVKK